MADDLTTMILQFLLTNMRCYGIHYRNNIVTFDNIVTLISSNVSHRSDNLIKVQH